MAKQYGLILPGQQKKKPLFPPAVERSMRKPTIFDESSESSDDNGAPQLQMKPSSSAMGPGAMERRMARQIQAKALAEDPTVFQYDELFDDMDAKREEQQQTKSKEPRKPKYIGRLMKFAERRKLENELRVERQVQKEREAEGEEFKDKESFVTAAYRKKLEEMRLLEEQEKRDEYLEAVGDVTKQKDLDGFYRHIYEQKVGTAKEEVTKPDMPKTSAGDELQTAEYKPIKSGKVPPQRAYRKRQASEDDEEQAAEREKASAKEAEAKKVHLQNNIDADSDFSIDSDSSSESDDENADKDKTATAKKGKKHGDGAKSKSAVAKTDSSKIALKLDAAKAEQPASAAAAELKVSEINQEQAAEKALVPPQPKRDKREIWQKRTVGAVFDEAVQRYYERKAARAQA